MALHAPQVHGFFSVPVDHLNAIAELGDHFAQRDLANTVVVSPDLGNAKPASALARLLGVPVAAGSKVRLSDDEVKIESIVGDVTGKNVIVLDDEIATGGSIVALLDVLRTEGVRRISLAFTHPLFTGKCVQRLSEQIDVDEVVVTNTVPVPPDKQFDSLRIRSVAPLFAEAIRRIHHGESVSSLFTSVPQHSC
jgi:ribose-phosphate pyrophosphokinase